MAHISPSDPPPTRLPRLCATPYAGVTPARDANHCGHPVQPSMGYVRVAIQAWLFGATAAMDAFVLAFSVPSMLQVILLTGPLSGVLVPTHGLQA